MNKICQNGYRPYYVIRSVMKTRQGNENNSQLPQTDPRDALRYAHRVVLKDGRAVW